MSSMWVVLLIVTAYMVALAAISFVVRRSSQTSDSFASGGPVFPSILIGFLLMSEFIGTSATIGTSQKAYSVGISAAWNVVALGIGFVLFSVFLAKKFKALGENTISGALARTYGESVRITTSVIMTCALLIVAVAIYASGGAVLSSLRDINRSLAIVIVGALATVYVVVGGTRSVVYTNVVHAIMKLAAVVLLARIGIFRIGGLGELRARLPAEAFNLRRCQLGTYLRLVDRGDRCHLRHPVRGPGGHHGPRSRPGTTCRVLLGPDVGALRDLRRGRRHVQRGALPEDQVDRRAARPVIMTLMFSHGDPAIDPIGDAAGDRPQPAAPPSVPINARGATP